MDRFYVLGADARTPQLVDVLTWARAYEQGQHRRHGHGSEPRPGDGWALVALDDLPLGARVSTVFLGLDHRLIAGPPLVFETMVFWKGHPLDETQQRYSTWDQALAGHADMLARVLQMKSTQR